jgi:hypothetical protein
MSTASLHHGPGRELPPSAGSNQGRYRMRPDQLERRLRARLDALSPSPRAELLHVLMLPVEVSPFTLRSAD